MPAKDADGNGYEDDVYGYNFVEDTGLISWTGEGNTGHGTHVAGTIAAVNGNGQGRLRHRRRTRRQRQRCEDHVVPGLCGRHELHAGSGRPKRSSMRPTTARSSCSAAGDISRPMPTRRSSAPCWAPPPRRSGKRPIRWRKEALDYFIQNAGSPNGVIKGGLAVFAAGNEYAAIPSFPGAYSKCVTVGALDAGVHSLELYELRCRGGRERSRRRHGVLRQGRRGGSRRVARRGRYARHGLRLRSFPRGSSTASRLMAIWMAPRWPAPCVGSGGAGTVVCRAEAASFKADEFVSLLKQSVREIDDTYLKGYKLYYYTHNYARVLRLLRYLWPITAVRWVRVWSMQGSC